MSELQPVFTVKVWLDGDDDAEAQTDNFDNQLRTALAWMVERRYILNYQVKEES